MNGDEDGTGTSTSIRTATETKTNLRRRIMSMRETMTDIHDSRINYGYAWRHQQLVQLKRLVVENKEKWIAALADDLGRHPVETESGELACTIIEIDRLLAVVQDYNQGGKLRRPVSSPAFLAPCHSSIRYEPLLAPGVLIIAPFNYPVNLSLVPAAGSLAAGNPTVLKMSDVAPSVSHLMATLVSHYFPATTRSGGAVTVVEGGGESTTQLLQSGRWGKIFFTGSTRVGKIVATHAAQTLSPIVLELGGKSPVYISEHINPNEMAVLTDRIVWGKLYNGGQTCVAPDHIVCHTAHMDQFCDSILHSIQRFTATTGNTQNSSTTKKNNRYEQVPRIINQQHTERLLSALHEIEDDPTGKKGTIMFGGAAQCDRNSKQIEPTVIINPALDTQLMTDEIFGPILPICRVESEQDGIEHIQQIQGTQTPLALYCFTNNDAVFERISIQCRSGTLVRNDVVIQFSSSYLPLGGLGTSGQGGYHGQYSLDTFSHRRSTLCRPTHPLVSEFGGLRYPPYYQRHHDDPTGNKMLQHRTDDPTTKTEKETLARYQLNSRLLLVFTKFGSFPIPIFWTKHNLLLIVLVLIHIPLYFWAVQYYIKDSKVANETE